MNEALLLGRQVLLIFIYIFLGIVLVRGKLLTQDEGKTLSNVSLYLITPCILLDSFQREMDSQNLSGLILAFVLAIVFHGISFLVGFLAIHKRQNDTRYRIERMGAMFSNCGYMAIPLISVALGDIGIFYAAAFVSIFNIFLWSVGIMTLTAEKHFSIRKAVLNPGVLGFLAGVLIYSLQIPLPSLVSETISSIAILNSPIAMITVGIYLSHINIKKTLTNSRLYYATFLRLIVIPAVMLALVKIANVQSWFSGAPVVILSIMLCGACPVPAATVLLSSKLDLDSEYSAQFVAISTLFSILTIPLLTYCINSFLL